MPDIRVIADISTGRLLCRDAAGAWLIQERQQLSPYDPSHPIALLPLFERAWPDLAASLDPVEANDFAQTLAPGMLALALRWRTDYWAELAVSWIESDRRFIEPLREELTALAATRRKGNQNLRHRARRLAGRP